MNKIRCVCTIARVDISQTALRTAGGVEKAIWFVVYKSVQTKSHLQMSLLFVACTIMRKTPNNIPVPVQHMVKHMVLSYLASMFLDFFVCR